MFNCLFPLDYSIVRNIIETFSNERKSLKSNEMEILIATQNTGKIKELTELLKGLPIALRSLNDFGKIAEPEETGATFMENAILKAKYYSLKTGLSALADDSGLEVEALDNAPGVFSARYAGLNAADAQRTEKLLTELGKTGDQNRFAKFVCAIAFTDEKAEVIYTATGICHGKIAFAPRGNNGFGYDPVFIPENFTETFGEVSGDIKQKISHRGRAIEKIIAFLRDYYAA